MRWFLCGCTGLDYSCAEHVNSWCLGGQPESGPGGDAATGLGPLGSKVEGNGHVLDFLKESYGQVRQVCAAFQVAVLNSSLSPAHAS